MESLGNGITWRRWVSQELNPSYGPEERPMSKVWIYQAADLKVFATAEIAEAWFAKHDPEGVAFAYDVIGEPLMDTEEPAIPLLAPGL
jgi:hypothetical protein